MINVQGIKRGRKQTLPVKLGEVIKHIDDLNTHYSMAFNDSLTLKQNSLSIKHSNRTIFIKSHS
mgnify:CR=1 FL=1